MSSTLEMMVHFGNHVTKDFHGMIQKEERWTPSLFRCQDSSMVRLLRSVAMVSGLSPISAKISLRVRRVASSL